MPNAESDRPVLTIFVSSPGDVEQERRLAERVIARLSAEYASRARIAPIFWEHEPLRATATFQEEIPRPSTADIFVCILWSRIGTRLPSTIRRPDGTPFGSGTEFELEDARAGFQATGRPDVLVYRKTADPLVSLRDKQALLDSISQREALDRFVERWFHDRAEGTLIAAFHPFAEAAQFEEILETHLRKLITRRLPPAPPAPTATRPTWTAGSPFRGLRNFEAEHAPVFFGRTRAVERALRALRAQAAEGRAILLVTGASGSGKSSLVRAGVLPLLTQPGVIEGVALWRQVLLTPSERGDGDVSALLARRLVQALPALSADGTTTEALAVILRRNPEAASALLKGGLSQAAGDVKRREGLENQPQARLVLLVDQLEELFTLPGIDVAERTAFASTLESLVRGGRVFVLATLRSDFYARLAEFPALLALKEGHGQLDLTGPTPGELADMIRLPAQAAALRFERDADSGKGLDEILVEAAAQTPDGLALLEFVLEALYEKRSDDGTLRLAAYRELGGLEGAVGSQAEQAFSKLAPHVQQELSRVFRKLVTVAGPAGSVTGEPGETSVTQLIAPLADFTPGSPAEALVRAFIDARLFVSDAIGGKAVVRVVHEALFRTWPRLRDDWIPREAENLRVRARVVAAAEQGDLLSGVRLFEAQALAAAWGDHLGPREHALIRASSNRQRRLAWIRRGAVAGICALAVATVVSAWRSYEALAKQYLYRADSVESTGDVGLQLLWIDKAIDATPPFAPAAHRRRTEFALRAQELVVPRAVVPGRFVEVKEQMRRMLTMPEEHTLQLWSTETWTPVGGVMRAQPFPPEFEHEAARWGWSSDGARLFTRVKPTSVQLWDPERGVAVGDEIPAWGVAKFSPDGSLLVTRREQAEGETVQLWETQGGRAVGKPIRSLPMTCSTCSDDEFDPLYSPDGQRLLTWVDENALRLWDTKTGDPVGNPLPVEVALPGVPIPHGGGPTFLKECVNESRIGARVARALRSAAPSDCERFFAQTDAEEIQLWDTKTAKAIGTPLRIVASDWINSEDIGYAPAGGRLFTKIASGKIQLWDAITGVAVGAPLAHLTGYASFSDDGRYLATQGTDRALRVWDSRTATSLGEVPCQACEMVWKGPYLITKSEAPPGESAELQISALGLHPSEWRVNSRMRVAADFDLESPVLDPSGTSLVAAIGNSIALIHPISGETATKLTLVHAPSRWFVSPETAEVVAVDGTLLRMGNIYQSGLERQFTAPRAVYDAMVLHASPAQLVAHNDSEVFVWGMTPKSVLPMHLGEPKNADTFQMVKHIVFAPDRKKLFASTPRGGRLWTDTGRPLSEFATWAGKWAPAFSPNGELLFDGHFLRDSATFEHLASFELGSFGQPEFRFSADGSRFVTLEMQWSGGDYTGVVTIRDSKTRAVVGDPIPCVDTPCASFSASGSIVVETSRNTVQVFDFDGHPVGNAIRQDGLHDFFLAPDGRSLVTIDARAHVWDLSTRESTELDLSSRVWRGLAARRMTSLEGNRHQLWEWDGVTYRRTGSFEDRSGRIPWVTPDEEVVVTLENRALLHLWDAKTGLEIGPSVDRRFDDEAIAFDTVNHRIAASDGAEVRLWSWRTGLELTPPMVNDAPVTAVAFSPDGTLLATGSESGTVRLWDPETGVPLDRSVLHNADDSMVAEFAADNKRVVTLLHDQMCFWDATGRPSGAPVGEGVQALSFSFDRRRVLAREGWYSARLRDGETGAPIGGILRKANPHDEELDFVMTFAVLSGDGLRAMTFHQDAGALLWKDLRTENPKSIETISNPRFVVITGTHVVVCESKPSPEVPLSDPDFIWKDWRTDVKVWDLETLNPVHGFQIPQVRAAAATATEIRLLTTAGRERIWDPLTKSSREAGWSDLLALSEKGYRIDEGRYGNPLGVVDTRDLFQSSPDSGLPFSTRQDLDNILLLESKTQRVLARWRNEDRLSRVVFSPRGDSALVICNDGTAFLRNVDDGKLSSSERKAFAELVAGRQLTDLGVTPLSAQDLRDRLARLHDSRFGAAASGP